MPSRLERRKSRQSACVVVDSRKTHCGILDASESIPGRQRFLLDITTLGSPSRPTLGCDLRNAGLSGGAGDRQAPDLQAQSDSMALSHFGGFKDPSRSRRTCGDRSGSSQRVARGRAWGVCANLAIHRRSMRFSTSWGNPICVIELSSSGSQDPRCRAETVRSATWGIAWTTIKLAQRFQDLVDGDRRL